MRGCIKQEDHVSQLAAGRCVAKRAAVLFHFGRLANLEFRNPRARPTSPLHPLGELVLHTGVIRAESQRTTGLLWRLGVQCKDWLSAVLK
jgi:hypothetical protein